MVGGEQSLLEQLAAARNESAENRETFIKIPGYEETGIDVLAKYKLLTGPEIEEISKKLRPKAGGQQRSLWNVNLAAALDTMARACIGIYVQRPTDEEPVPLTVNGEPILHYGDPNLKVALGIDDSVNTTRRVIIAAFCDNELAVSDHSVKLNRWFQNTNRDVDADFLGEG